ncbi:MAG TPA: hemerythrin domain-containing protein [Methylobacter sp.]|jgi:hemerythrin
MPIKWDSRLSVGNTYIDLEHKLIISLINALEAVLRHPDEKDALRFFIDQLYEFAEDHFLHEEKLQLKFMFPHYEENKKGHQRLMTELDVIKNIIYRFVDKENTTLEEAKETSEKANYLIREWFIDHIIKSDMKMKGFMDNVG